MSKKIKVYPPTEACAACKGECCRHMACHYAPSDFPDLSFDGLKQEIEKGRISIDWWEGNPRAYFLRARHVGEPVVKGSWGGRCVNLTDTGCSLSWEERPTGGKALKPHSDPDGICTTSYSKEKCKNDWKKHAEVLNKLVEYFDEGEPDDLLSIAMEVMKCLSGLRG